MKINTKKSKLSKSAIIISSVILAAIVCYGIFSFKSGFWPFKNTQTPRSSQASDRIIPPEGQSESTDEATTSAQTPATNEKTPVQNEPTENSPLEGEIRASITAINQTASYLQIRTLIDGVFTDGECKLSLSRNTTTIPMTTGVQALASSSTCKGFDVPANQLTPGQWQLTIDITTNDGRSKIIKNINID